jgi:hypothetical protein
MVGPRPRVVMVGPRPRVLLTPPLVAGMLDKVHSDLPVVWCQKTIAMLRRPLLVVIISKWQ